MAENNTNAQRYVRIRTNVGWVSVPLLSSGEVDLEELKNQMEELKRKLDEKLDKSAWIGKSLIDQIFENSDDISNNFGDNTDNGGN